jgi:hypothetical protein
MPECQTTAGCKCSARNWPWQSPQLPSYTAGATSRSLSDFTDAEIAREYHARALQKLGDQTKVVGFKFDLQ